MKTERTEFLLADLTPDKLRTAEDARAEPKGKEMRAHFYELLRQGGRLTIIHEI